MRAGEHDVSAAPITIVGAGVSAEVIARRCAEAGLRLRFAVRRPERGEQLAGRLAQAGLPGAEVSSIELAASNTLDDLLERSSAIINTAGPFVDTAPPLIESALRTCTPYIDLANELRATHGLLARSGQARRRRVVLVTGAGFGVAAAELIANRLARLLADITTIEVASAPAVAHSTSGVAQTVIESLPAGGYVIRDGLLRRRRLGSILRRVPLPGGEQLAAAVPTGDLLAVQRATGAASVTVYSTEFPTGLAARIALPALGSLLAVGFLRRGARRLVRARPDMPSGPHSLTWACARSRDGTVREATLRLGEGYEVTGQVAAACVRAVIDGGPPGAWTPGALRGDELESACGAIFDEELS